MILLKYQINTQWPFFAPQICRLIGIKYAHDCFEQIFDKKTGFCIIYSKIWIKGCQSVTRDTIHCPSYLCEPGRPLPYIIPDMDGYTVNFIAKIHKENNLNNVNIPVNIKM